MSSNINSSGTPTSSVRNLFFSSRTTPQVHPMTTAVATDSVSEAPSADLFQRHVADRLQSLVGCGAEGADSKGQGEGKAETVLSLGWLIKALQVVLESEEEFKELGALRAPSKGSSSASSGKAVMDFMDRGLKALDICNAIRDGIEQVRLWQKHVEIVVCALDARHKYLAEAQFRRARKALCDLMLYMSDDNKDLLSGSGGAHHAASRNRSFVRGGGAATHTQTHNRSLSWSVSRTWSAGRQLQAMAVNLVPPRSAEGTGMAIYTMNNLILMACWVMVAAIPCQDRSLNSHFSVPKSVPWAGPLMAVHDRVMEVSKKRDRRGSVGLLHEVHQMSNSVRHLMDLTESASLCFPLTDAQDQEVRKEVVELTKVWDALKEGLDPLEKHIRQLFVRIVNARTETLDSVNRHGD